MFTISREQIIMYLIMIPIVLIALTFHEVAHGYVSYKLGDPTARNLGRLSLNPIKHIDPIGFICMIVFRFGWAKPVPVNSRYYRKPRRDMALVAFAGPAVNLILGFIGVIILNLFGLIPAPAAGFGYNVYVIAFNFIELFAILNVYLAVFNLIPIPPLDGSRIAYIFLPTKIYFGIMRYERYIMIGMLILLYLGFFSSTIGWIANHVIYGMDWLVKLIPIF